MGKFWKCHRKNQYPHILYLALVISLVSCNRNAELINAGISGNNTLDLLERLDRDVLDENPDLVIIMVGTNDVLNSAKMISYRDYAENLWQIIRKIKEAGVEVLLLSPTPVDTVYLFERHERSFYEHTPGMKLDSLSGIMQQLSSDYNTLFLDLGNTFKARNLPRHNQDLYIRNPTNSGVRDGVHPTVPGYQLIAETIFQFLVKNDLLHGKMKIVCFGDSITYGSGAKGAGTLAGENYPSFLSMMINEQLKQ